MLSCIKHSTVFLEVEPTKFLVPTCADRGVPRFVLDGSHNLNSSWNRAGAGHPTAPRASGVCGWVWAAGAK